MSRTGAASKSRSRRRENSRPWHMWRGLDGHWVNRAVFTENEAQRVARQLFDLTGRTYIAYACRYPDCDGWHIRPDRRIGLERVR